MTVQAMVLQGFTPKVIEAKTGVKAQTVMTWTWRHQWKGALDTVAELRETDTLEGLSKQVRGSLAKRLAQAATTLPSKAQSMKRELSIQADLEPMVRNARTVFGWSEASTPSSVNVNVQGDSLIQVATNPVVKQSEQT